MNSRATDIHISRLPAVQFAELADSEQINARLLRGFERAKDGPDVRRSHGFEGRFENTYIDIDRIPELQAISQFALNAARQVLGQHALKYGFWFNEMAPGHRTTLHSHEEFDELLSAVYYVTCPPESGRLLLHDADAQIAVEPRPGLLVMFPPDLPHEVEHNRSDATRLSVAFNFGPADSPN